MKPALRGNKRASVLLLCLAVVLLEACRKDLCYNHFRQAEIGIGWEYAWERDYGRDWSSHWDVEAYGMEYADLCPGTPEGVTVVVYDEAGEYNERFLKPEGGNAILSEGTHSFLFYNNNTEYIVFNFDDMAATLRPEEVRATTTTRTRSTLKAMHSGERTVSPPDMLYGAFAENIPGVGLHESVALPVVMRPLVYTYVIRYEFSSGLEHVALARGALAGMAEAVYLWDGRTSDEKATILFDCEKTSWGAQAIVKSFGVPSFPDRYYPRAREAGEAAGHNYVLNLELRLQNGKVIELEPFDVTEQMQEQPRGGVITVRNVIVPESEFGVDSEFEIIVDDWDEYKDIDLEFGTILPGK